MTPNHKTNEGSNKSLFELKKHQWVVVVIVFLLAYRLMLISSGHMFFLDENRFTAALQLVELRWKYPVEALSKFFEVDGRPGYILFSIIPAVMQKGVVMLGLVLVGSPRVYDISSFFNILYCLVIFIYLYIILRILVKDSRFAAMGVLLYGLLANSYVYIRHLLPYDLALALFMAALYLVVRGAGQKQFSRRDLFLSGILSGLAYSVYPGYFLFVGIIGGSLFFGSKERNKNTVIHLGAALLVLISWEVLAQMVGTSYYLNSVSITGAINMGNSSEALAFLPKYLIAAEGYTGYILLMLVASYLLVVWKADRTIFKPIFILAVGGYLFYGVLGTIFHKLVFYGRIIHMFFPLMIIAGVMVLKKYWPYRWGKITLGLVFGVVVVSFIRVGIPYISLDYPKDFFYRYWAEEKAWRILRLNENEPPRELKADKHWGIGINLRNLYPITLEKYSFTDMGEGMILVAEKPHPLNFTPYQFEGYSEEKRQLIVERDIQMQLYLYPEYLEYLSAPVEESE
jgi:hypothetical protein